MSCAVPDILTAVKRNGRLWAAVPDLRAAAQEASITLLVPLALCRGMGQLALALAVVAAAALLAGGRSSMRLLAVCLVLLAAVFPRGVGVFVQFRVGLVAL